MELGSRHRRRQRLDRGNISELLYDSAGVVVPIGTRSIELVMTAERLTEGPGITYNDGYADRPLSR